MDKLAKLQQIRSFGNGSRKDPRISAALPCAISVFGEDDNTETAFVRPAVILGLFEMPELKTVSEEVGRTVTEIAKEAGRERIHEISSRRERGTG